MDYETLLEVAKRLGIYTYEMKMVPSIKGLYADNTICINNNQSTVAKACTLIEEIAHHHLTVGNILDQTDLNNRKQEIRARQWAYQCMIPIEKIVQAHISRISGRYELADFLDVTEEFLQAAIDRYTSKYGLFLKVDSRYTIHFEPLGVIETFLNDNPI